MAYIENNCLNCKYANTCKLARKSMIVIWKNCNGFKPSMKALEKYKKEREKERKAKFGYLR